MVYGIMSFVAKFLKREIVSILSYVILSWQFYFIHFGLGLF